LDGVNVPGRNIENASYGLKNCAERMAIFQAVAHSHTAIEGVVVYTPTLEPTARRGACRQVMNEFGPDTEFVARDGPRITCVFRVNGLRVANILNHEYLRNVNRERNFHENAESNGCETVGADEISPRPGDASTSAIRKVEVTPGIDTVSLWL
jgi:cytidine deaminase